MNRARLLIRRSDGQETTREICASESLLGRGQTCEIQLIDQGISREHAAILWEDDCYTIEDLQSTNGTQVNGKRIRSAVLSDGDRIEVGDTVCTFRLDD